jgi:shikimate kinase
MKTGIALIGFMGTGKTAVGKLLADKLGKKFIELDAEIEKKAGKTIPDIFSDDGEIRFRELEIDAAKEVAGKKNVVIACGGGIVLNAINIFRLRQECVIVCLTASPAEIIKRTSVNAGNRPLLAGADKEKQVKELLKYRRPFYERMAEISIDTTGIDAPGVVKKIQTALRMYESHD